MAATDTTTGSRSRTPTTTPSRVPAGGASAPRTGEGGFLGGILRFFREVRSELKKVTWPSKEDVQNLTVIVIVVSVAVGTVLGAIDAVFEQLFRLLLQR